MKVPCAWCILYRPGCAPNYITVNVVGAAHSHGICPECEGAFRARKVPA